MRIYDFKKALNAGKLKDPSNDYYLQIKGPKDHVFNNLKWGALDKCVYYCTN